MERGYSWTGSHLLLGERAALHQLFDLRVKASAAAVVYVHGLHTAAVVFYTRNQLELKLVAGGEAARERARGTRLTEWGRKSGRGDPRKRLERLIGKPARQVGLPAPHMGPLAPCRVRRGKWFGVGRCMGPRCQWARSLWATWSEDRKMKVTRGPQDPTCQGVVS